MIKPGPPAHPRPSYADLHEYKRKTQRLTQWVRSGVGPGPRTGTEQEVLYTIIKELKTQILKQQEVIGELESVVLDLSGSLEVSQQSLLQLHIDRVQVKRNDAASGVIQSFAYAALAKLRVHGKMSLRVEEEQRKEEKRKQNAAIKIQCCWRQAVSKVKVYRKLFEKLNGEGHLMNLGSVYLQFMQREVQVWDLSNNKPRSQCRELTLNLETATITFNDLRRIPMVCETKQKLELLQSLCSTTIHHTVILQATRITKSDSGYFCNGEPISVFLYDPMLEKTIINFAVCSCTPEQYEELLIVLHNMRTPHVKYSEDTTRWWFIKTGRGQISIHKNTAKLGEFASVMILPSSQLRCLTGNGREISISISESFVPYLKSFCFIVHCPFSYAIKEDNQNILSYVVTHDNKIVITSEDRTEQYIVFNEYSGKCMMGDRQLDIEYPADISAHVHHIHPDVPFYHCCILGVNGEKVLLRIEESSLYACTDGVTQKADYITFNMNTLVISIGVVDVLPAEDNVWEALLHILDVNTALIPQGLALLDTKDNLWLIRDREGTLATEVVRDDVAYDLKMLYYDNANTCFIPRSSSHQPTIQLKQESLNLVLKHVSVFLAKRGIKYEMNSFLDAMGNLVTLRNMLIVNDDTKCTVTKCELSMRTMEVVLGTVPNDQMMNVKVVLSRSRIVPFVIDSCLKLGVGVSINLDVVELHELTKESFESSTTSSYQHAYSNPSNAHSNVSDESSMKRPLRETMSLFINAKKNMSLVQEDGSAPVNQILFNSNLLTVIVMSPDMEQTSYTLPVIPSMNLILREVLSEICLYCTVGWITD